MKFYGRAEHINNLRGYINEENHNSSEIIVISGRRRIGKTRLVQEVVNKSKHLYFFVTRKREVAQLRDWTTQIQEELSIPYLGSIQRIDDLLMFLFEYGKNEKLTIIFDEFQNFYYTDPSVYSVFQMIFDRYKYESKLTLIFSGSSYSLMEKIFKSAKEPLFGRSNEIIKLSYLSLKSQREFLFDQGLKKQIDAIYLFSVFDGVPKYMEDLSKIPYDSFLKRLRKILLTKDWIWEEGEKILMEEFGKEYSSYYSILSAIAKGRRILDEIKQFTGIKEVGSYIRRLEVNYNLIERRIPVTEIHRKTKKGRYYLKDNFFSFWFGLVESKRYLREIGQKETAAKQIVENLNQFTGRIFEKMIIRLFIEENPLNISFTRLGSYWNRKGDVEIDVVAYDESSLKAYFFEVKLSKKRVTQKIKTNLIENSNKIPELENYEKFYYIIYPENNEIIYDKINI